ncbi:MAG: AMP-binding protein [Verrucomicrobia bacterium]|nr:AMP-binding protein [Verrucomicrobiota bacterium]
MERARLKALVEETGCARAVGRMRFVLDPGWGLEARREAEALLTLPDGRPPEEERGWLALPTGGSGGSVKWARHDEATLAAAVAGLRAHFGIESINAVDVLPAYHVSGLMARVRAEVSKGMHLPWAWKRLEAGDCPELPGRPDGWVLSLVPTQLQRLLRQPAATGWLRRLRVVFLGGGPAWPDLLRRAREEGLRLAPSYGMTETAAMVAAVRPEEFLAGREELRPLPHAELAADGEGRLRVSGASVCRGLWPEWRGEGCWTTGDRAEARGEGWVILGRADQVIITGGRKVDAARVEAALRGAGVWDDVVVLGVPDPEWGESVVVFHPAGAPRVDPAASLAGLAAWERPRRWVAVERWPRNAAGKVDRAALRQHGATLAAPRGGD